MRGAVSVAVPRRLEGVGEAGVPEAREELIALAPGPVPLGLALGVAPERLGEPEGLVASLAGGVGVPAAEDHELAARRLAIEIPHPLGLGLEAAGLDRAGEEVSHRDPP